MNNRTKQRQVYAIVRVDVFQGDDVQWRNRITVKAIVPSEAIAEREITRLNELNGDKGAVYFWQTTRLWPTDAS